MLLASSSLEFSLDWLFPCRAVFFLCVCVCVCLCHVSLYAAGSEELWELPCGFCLLFRVDVLGTRSNVLSFGLTSQRFEILGLSDRVFRHPVQAVGSHSLV